MKGLQYTRELVTSTEMLSLDCSDVIYDICASEGLLHDDCSLALDASADSIKMIIYSKITAWPRHQEEYFQNRDRLVKTILHSRYANLYNLLGVSV